MATEENETNAVSTKSTQSASSAVAGSTSNDGDNTSKALELDHFIYKQTNAQENSYFKILAEGFQSLRDVKENKRKPLFALEPSEEQAPKRQSSIKHFSTVATVNFIDPTTKPANANGPKSTNLLSRQSVSGPVIENVFEKLSYIFERDYGSTLRSVQYKSMRSGENDVISSLPVHPVLTRTGSGSSNGDANVPWGGNAGTAAAPVTDPSEWHNGPFCHVYIAACEGVDHYKNKIRPSLQAFVSQIESAATNTVAPQSTQGGSSAHYLILYVPIGSRQGSTDSNDSSESAAPVRKAFTDRLHKARQRIVNYNSSDMNDSQHSGGSLDSEEFMSDHEDGDSPPVALNLLTKNERGLYKRIAADYPNGKTCVLSLTSLDTLDDESVTSSGIAIKTQEWNTFNRMLGAVIVNGFKDRCRRYNEELRRLDAQRAIAATQQTPGSRSRSKNPSAAFNLTYFFLVKESLAFTYEQMHLPGEALLQYDEFRAFLPDLSDKDIRKIAKARKKSKAYTDTMSPTLIELADAGDSIGFRRKIRSELDLMPLVDVMRRYLFAREMSLLFKMEQPVELITRSEAFSKTMYFVMLRGLPELPEEEQFRRKIEAKKWMIQFSWDVKSACDLFLVELSRRTTVDVARDTMSVDTGGSDMLSVSSENSQSDQAVARRLSEFLDLSRLLLKELGDTELSEPNPLRVYENTPPVDIYKLWEPWQPTTVKPRDTNKDVPPRGSKDERKFLLAATFESTAEYEKTYLSLVAAIVALSRYGGRRRFAYRLQDEIGEYHIRKGNLKSAAAAFRKIVKVYRSDQWDRLHFWRLFRLAFCQRTTAKPTDYLKTLVSCFSPRTVAIAPPTALDVLQDDLDVIIGHPEVGEARYGKLAFIETDMEISETSSDDSSMGIGVDRKQLIKRFCNVGENVRIKVTVTSHLPRPIFLDSLKIFIVSLSSFSTIIENRESVEEEDAFYTLATDPPPVHLHPGKNVFSFDWQPSSSGQFVFSTIEMVWKEGFFYYDSMDLPAPLLGVDVLPSEPTHTLTIKPGYLVPGHDQQIRIILGAGSDLVTGGKLQLTCTEGISLIPPGEDPAGGNWQTECELGIKSVDKASEAIIVTHVRCELMDTFAVDESSKDSPSDRKNCLFAKAFTTYLHPSEANPDHTKIPSMKTVLEAVAPILEKTALSVESVDTIWTTPGEKLILSIKLVSNTPHHFTTEGWNLVLPPPLETSGTDLNGDMLRCSVSSGDQLALAFECTVGTKLSETKDEPTLQVKLRDSVGKTFPLDLPLNLTELYKSVEDGRSPKTFATVTSSLKVNVSEGTVGEPVSMTFHIDCKGLAAVSMANSADAGIVYSIEWEDSDWLVGGKVNGIIDVKDSSPSVDIVGIPSAPGRLARYPRIDLGYSSATGDMIPLNVTFQHPPPFQSHSQASDMGIAFPSSKLSL